MGLGWLANIGGFALAPFTGGWSIPAAAALGTSAIGLGLSADQLASADLNTIINSVLAREGLNTERRGQNMALAGGIGETIGTLAGIWLGRDSEGG